MHFISSFEPSSFLAIFVPSTYIPFGRLQKKLFGDFY